MLHAELRGKFEPDSSDVERREYVSIFADTDDVFFDSARRRVYVIGSEGFIDVIQREGDALRRIAHLATRDGARTGTWAAEPNLLYLATPSRRSQPAEIRVFAASD